MTRTSDEPLGAHRCCVHTHHCYAKTLCPECYREEEWPEGTEIPFRSDGSFGLPEEGVFVIKHMPDYEAQGATCSQCGHPPHDEDCDAVVGYDHLNGDHECGCPGEEEED